MIIKIPFKTPSVNHLYGHRGYRMFLTYEAKKLRDEIIKLIPLHDFHTGDKLKVTTEVHEDWFTLEEKIKKKDVANREKFLIDSIFQGLELDDSQIFEHEIKKIQNNNEEFAVITISPL